MVLAAGGWIVIQHKAVPVPKSTLRTFGVQDWLLSTVTTFATPLGPYTPGLQPLKWLMDSARLAPAGTVAPVTPSFKYCVYCYSDMMRPTDQERSTIDKTVCRSQYRLRSACHTTRGHVGERQVVRDAEGPGEEVGERLHRDFCEDEQVWPGKYSSRSESPGPTTDPAPRAPGLARQTRAK